MKVSSFRIPCKSAFFMSNYMSFQLLNVDIAKGIRNESNRKTGAKISS